MADGTTRKARAERTRRHLLDTGLSILREQPAGQLFERLQAKPVCARAGLSTGAFYTHFDSADRFAEALLEHALAEEPNPPFAVAATTFEELVADGTPFAEALIEASAAAMRFQDTNPSFALQLLITAKARHDHDVTQRLSRMYESVTGELAAYFEQILERLGREIRPPFTIVDLAGSVESVFDGLQQRRMVRPGDVPDDRMGLLFIGLLDLMTRATGSNESVEHWTAQRAPVFQ